MDDELLVVAAAGSGKSSSIVAKAGYALAEKLCAPEQILLLAFNSEVAKELRSRIGERLNLMEGADRIRVKTFHGFGLEVIGAATGSMPTAAPWVTARGQDIVFIGRLIDDLCAEDPQFLADWNLFRLLFFKGIGQWDRRDEPEDYDPDSRRKRGFRTLRGEIVKSKSERLIADWLFLYGINYQYEAPYKFDTTTSVRRQYRPDFYYPEIDVYHEHFALNAKGEPPEEFRGYLEGVEWKRAEHRTRGTRLFETTAHQLRTGEALRELFALFRQHGIEPTIDVNREIEGDPAAPQAIAKLIRVFQQHMKGSRKSVNNVKAAIRTTADAFEPRCSLFLGLYEKVAKAWEDRLSSQHLVDFEDMLNASADLIEAGKYACDLKLILADEFQDTSRARMRLIQAAVAKSGAQLTAVGDDWQSINRFAGADVSLMSGFQKQYPHASIRLLARTFRCPQDLCDVTSAFISKNPTQIRKEVRTENPRLPPSIHILAAQDEAQVSSHLRAQIASLHRGCSDVDAQWRPKLLILGRYRKDRPLELEAWRELFGDRIDIRFSTIHGAKGLEADWLFVVNAIEGTLGFPSQIEDDPIIQLALPVPEIFPFGEERRLLYVALTRAKRAVGVYTLTRCPSQFLVELQRDHGIAIEELAGQPVASCAACGKGTVVERVNRRTRERFKSCSRFPKCDGKSRSRLD